ncbi:MAG: hypothetical protein U9M92_01930 [Patescibacteria group bacterium]|nr:hypothetical protein [Patescibacteria group bacterium]
MSTTPNPNQKLSINGGLQSWWGLLSPKTISLALFFVLAVVYAFYQTHALAEGPEIIINQPVDNSTLEEPLVVVEGQATRIAHLFLNGGQVFTDENGHFTERLLLAPGYNLISLAARDKFDRVVEKRLELIYQPLN